jgi:hypothetical protein
VREIPRSERAEGVLPRRPGPHRRPLLLETVVIDVEGLTEDDGGTPIKYTRELGEKAAARSGLSRVHGRRGLCRLGGRAAPQGRPGDSRQKTDRRPDLAAGLGRQDRRHRAGGDRGGPPARPALRRQPRRSVRHLVFEAHAFRELSTDRPVGFDRGAIPWRSIDAFAEALRPGWRRFRSPGRIIRAMDAAYLAHYQSSKSSRQNDALA